MIYILWSNIILRWKLIKIIVFCFNDALILNNNNNIGIRFYVIDQLDMLKNIHGNLMAPTSFSDKLPLIIYFQENLSMYNGCFLFSLMALFPCGSANN